eukprot:COSAG06_NODE_2976_length_5999_cov_10.483565_3_plen_98_part_00
MLCDTVTRYTVFMPSQSEMNFSSPLQPSFWSPAESSGKSHHITSHRIITHCVHTLTHLFVAPVRPLTKPNIDSHTPPHRGPATNPTMLELDCVCPPL